MFGKRHGEWKALDKEDEGSIHTALLELLRDAEFKSSSQILTLKFKILKIVQINIYQLSFANLACVMIYFGEHNSEKYMGLGILVTAIQTILRLHSINKCLFMHQSPSLLQSQCSAPGYVCGYVCDKYTLLFFHNYSTSLSIQNKSLE